MITSSIIDTDWIRQYAQSIRTICRLPMRFSAQMRASYGGPITLWFGPVRVGAHPQILLTGLVRSGFPENLSQSQWDVIVQQARERYGTNFFDERPADVINGREPATPHAKFQGKGLILKMASENPENFTPQWMEQPGCSDKPPSLD
jgi:hypothetical protein